MTDLSAIFDRVAVINLRRRPDRWEAFQQRAAAAGLSGFQRFEATDGLDEEVPDWFTAGRGAWGARCSHLAVARAAIADGCKNVLVFEDDAIFREGFEQGLRHALAATFERPWGMLYLGGSHLVKPKPGPRNVVRAANVNRLHAYVLHERAFADFIRCGDEDFYRRASAPAKLPLHFDHMLGFLHESGRHEIYAVEPWLCGQASGRSDIIPHLVMEAYWDLVPNTTVTLSSGS